MSKHYRAKATEKFNADDLCLEISVPEEFFGRLVTFLKGEELLVKDVGSSSGIRTAKVNVAGMELERLADFLVILSHSRMGTPSFRFYCDPPNRNWNLER